MKKFDRGGGRFRRQHHQGGTALRRLGDPGERVGDARPLVHGERGHRPETRAKRVGHAGGAALVRGRHKPRAGRHHRVGDVEVAAADHAEHVVDAVRRPRTRPTRSATVSGRQRSTSARTRHGLPEPPTIGSGPAITTAPVGGSAARFCSWVRPYLSWPAGTSGTGTAGRTSAPRPRRCPPSPRRRPGSASPRPAISRTPTEMPGVRPFVGERRRVVAAGVPAGAVQQPPALGQRPVLGLPGLDVLDLEQEVGVGARPARRSRAPPPGRSTG